MLVWQWVRTRWPGSGGLTNTTRSEADGAQTVAEVLDLLADLKGEIGRIRGELDAIRWQVPPIDIAGRRCR